MQPEFEGDISLVEELAEQDFHDTTQNGGTLADVFTSRYLGGGAYGWFCTLTKECQPNCN
ncbi:plantaricin C family lantibiotic [Streptomyces sp. ME19-01-6]|uniref:plantaricin C family lantibiotic n=1 Tax=Streptomyces sp. ME19-01-6 TaxID=3028686 RepID=UPI0029BC312E|nr:plantaricin C family lantibiotic [Streptomyces sp. ME19-01-6]MDX3229893.1 plantaricin C family lantibiotic [Streptomyces sp. ME19-01-6]